MVDEKRVRSLCGVNTLCFLHCFETVAWMTGRTYNKKPLLLIPKVFFSNENWLTEVNLETSH